MNASSEAQSVHASVETTVVKRMTEGLLGRAIGAVALIVLAIAGLAGAWSTPIAAIATIVFGATFLVEGGYFSRTQGRGELAGTEFLGGLTGVILGVLALLGIAPPTLLAAAVIVFGAALLFGHLADGAFGSYSLVAIGAIVLGVLAVVGLSAITLVLVALLALGAMELFTGLETGLQMAASHKNQQV